MVSDNRLQAGSFSIKGGTSVKLSLRGISEDTMERAVIISSAVYPSFSRAFSAE